MSKRRRRCSPITGYVDAVVHHKRSIVVLLSTSEGDKWFRLKKEAPVEHSDKIEIRNNHGFLYSLDGLYRGEDIGPCRPTQIPERHWDGNRWVDLDLFQDWEGE